MTSGYKVGYYEEPVSTTIHHETDLSCWVPLSSSYEGALAGPYTFTLSCRKVVRNGLGLDIGLLPNEQRFELPSTAYAATSKDAAAPRGIIVYVHGVGTTRWDQFILAEELASAGYVVAAPSFANSGANDRKDVMGSFGGGIFGGGLMAETLALRVHTMERVREQLRQRFGDLPVGLIGHSMGAMTISLLNWDVPKCLISGGMGPEGHGGLSPEGVGLTSPVTYADKGRAKPWPASQGSASLVFASKTNDLFFPATVQPGFTFATVEVADEEANSVPQAELPTHCMIVVEGISHTTWLADYQHHVGQKMKPFDQLYATTGVDLLGDFAPCQQRGPKLNENVMKPLIKRFFAKHVTK